MKTEIVDQRKGQRLEIQIFDGAPVFTMPIDEARRLANMILGSLPVAEHPQSVNTIKRMDIKEFREFGYLQEVNREFLHPLGLALEVIIDDETKSVKLGGVWDYREDPEGLFFADGEIDPLKTARIRHAWSRKAAVRIKNRGYILQPGEPHA